MTETGGWGRLGPVSEALPEALLLIDSRGIVVDANRAARRLLSDPRRLRGRRLTDLVATEPDRVVAYLRACSGSRQIVPGALAIRRHGVLVHYRCEGAVVEPATNGRPALTFVRLQPREQANVGFALLTTKVRELAREVGSRVRAEVMLEGQRQVLERVARGAPLEETLAEIVRIVEAQSPGEPRITVRLVGDPAASPADGFASPLRGTPGPEHDDEVQDEGTVPIRGRAAGHLGEVVLRYPAASSPDPVDRAVADQMAHIAGIAIERTRADRRIQTLLESERAAREEAEIANRAKDEFLAMVSHELRNPLNAIMGWVQLLAHDDLDAPTRARAVETITRNARMHVGLINDMLDFSRVTSGRLTLDTVPTSLGSVVEKACESVRPELERQGLTMTVDVAGSETLYDLDPNRLQQAVSNILWNAIKFTPEGGEIGVRVSVDEEVAQIEVHDTGCGIEPAFLPFVFDTFRQAEKGTTRTHGGLGLGLAIVRHIVELHGGVVRAESPGVGQGSTFTVSIPRRLVARSRSPQSIPTPPVPHLEGVHVLAVEDLPDARDLMRLTLERAGATVTTAGSAAEALAELATVAPDALVCDIGLPDVDGYDFVREWRARAATRDRPAVALTAYGRDIDRQRALEAGFDRHLTKPIDATRLLITVAELVSPRHPETG